MNMARQRKVLVSFETDGSTAVEADGFQGQQCSIATKQFEQMLTNGKPVDSDDKKPEFFQGTHSGFQAGTNR